MTEADVNTEVDTTELPHRTMNAEDETIVMAAEETAARKAGVKVKRTAKAVEKEKVNPEVLAAEVTSAVEPAAEAAIQVIAPAVQVTIGVLHTVVVSALRNGSVSLFLCLVASYFIW